MLSSEFEIAACYAGDAGREWLSGFEWSGVELS